MKNLLKKLFDLIYDNSCLICNNPSNDLAVCTNCEINFIERKEIYIKCFNELSVYSWGFYTGKLRDAIIELKSGKKKLAQYFAKRLSDFWNLVAENLKNDNYLVIPIPSHTKRIKERGYCQSSLIASEFAKIQKLRFSNNFIARVKETEYMNKLSSINDRQRNIKDSFKVINQFSSHKNILIIDDILTSGSTICEAARTIHNIYPHINLIGITVASGDKYL